MFEVLKKRAQNEKLSKKIDIDFIIKNGLIYHIKKRKKLCISVNCVKTVFELIHDKNNHANYHKAYQKLLNSVYMSKISRKIRQYIIHCFFVNSIK